MTCFRARHYAVKFLPYTKLKDHFKMKKIIITCIALLIALLFIQRERIVSLKDERELYRRNAETMLRQTERYKTENGLNVVRQRQLQLTLKEFEKYRAEDAATISRLRIDKRNIERVVGSRTSAEYRIETPVRDSVIIGSHGLTPDTLRCVDHHTEWLDITGCVDANGNFEGRVNSRDELIYVEHVMRKRFLGFLWRTRRIGYREQEIVSKNPCAEIISAQFVTIRK